MDTGRCLVKPVNAGLNYRIIAAIYDLMKMEFNIGETGNPR
jgi:hypothetical protein